MSTAKPNAAAAAALASILGFIWILTWGLSPGAGGLPLMPFPRERNAAEIVLNVAAFAVPALIVSGLLALTLRYSRGIILKTFILTGAFFAIIMVQGMIALSPSLLSALLLWLIMCLIVFSAFLSIMGFLPEGVNNAAYMIYGAVFGSFFGINSPTYSLILFIAIYSFYDVFFSRWVGSRTSRGEAEGRSLSIAIAFEGVQVGLGDIIFYSVMTAHAQHHFGPFIGLVTLMLIQSGSVVSILIAERYGVSPGLPLPMGLGVIPLLGRLLTGR